MSDYQLSVWNPETNITYSISPLQLDLPELNSEEYSPAPSSPVLHYPSPASLPGDVPISALRSTLSDPSTPQTWEEHPDSPIDYKAAARRSLEQNPNDVDLQNKLRYPPPSTEEVILLCPSAPPPVSPTLVNNKNLPPAPIIHPPSCLQHQGTHPHQYLVLNTARHQEWRLLHHTNVICCIPQALLLLNNPPVFPGVTLFRVGALHTIKVYPAERRLAIALSIQPLYACSQAIVEHPS